jgi:uncharacterized protein (DUF488 family)
MKIYTFGHSARSLEDFQFALRLVPVDILVDLRKKPQSRYYSHFNKNNLEAVFQKKYIFGGDYLGGSPEFHNDLLEYIENRGENKNNSNNKLFDLIDTNLKEKIFSKDQEFSNNEKRKFWITSNFLSEYISETSQDKAVYFLEKLFEKFSNKKLCFFCSEKDPTHCHRYHLLEKKWLQKFSDIEVIHIEDLIDKHGKKNNEQASLFT